jgi:hypothetical protein
LILYLITFDEVRRDLNKEDFLNRY